MIGPRTTLALILLLRFTAGAVADEFESALREFLALPASAEVIWPPRASVTAGALIDPEGHTTDLVSEDLQIVARPIGKFEFDLPADKLDPADAFWEWRSLLREKEKLTFKFILSDAEEVKPAAPSTAQTSAAKRSVLAAWRAAIIIDVMPKPEMPRERWMALRMTATTSNPQYVEAIGSVIRLHVPQGLAIAIDTQPVLRAYRPGPIKRPRTWALATIASGRYRNLPTMNQEWNKQSADVVRAVLSDWSPSIERNLVPEGDAGITRDGVLSFIDKFAQDAARSKAELLVVYYIGHMERAGTGSLSLLMEDAPEKSRVRPRAPASGVGNLRDLMQIIDQSEAELAPRQGSLDVAVLHRRLGAAKIPFVLLVDGCLEDPTYAAARERLGIVVDSRGGEPIYVGPGDASSALRQTLASLQDYPRDFPWLKSKDAVVLAATPGTLAYEEKHPIWGLGAPVGPLARRLVTTAMRTRWDNDRPSLIRLLNFTADRQDIGPQELSGSVSWSDWLPYLRRFDAQSFTR